MTRLDVQRFVGLPILTFELHLSVLSIRHIAHMYPLPTVCPRFPNKLVILNRLHNHQEDVKKGLFVFGVYVNVGRFTFHMLRT